MRASSRYLMLCAVLAAMLAAGCTSEFDRRLAEAEALRAEAAAAGAEWLPTGGLLDQARDEAAAGNTQRALELVEEARFQAETAIQQAENEAQAWRQRVVQ